LINEYMSNCQKPSDGDKMSHMYGIWTLQKLVNYKMQPFKRYAFSIKE